MIDFEKQTLRVGEKQSPILKWEVWFRTHTGLFVSLAEAVADAFRLEMPVEMIRPVTVAIGNDGMYEEVFR